MYGHTVVCVGETCAVKEGLIHSGLGTLQVTRKEHGPGQETEDTGGCCRHAGKAAQSQPEVRKCKTSLRPLRHLPATPVFVLTGGRKGEQVKEWGPVSSLCAPVPPPLYTPSILNKL